MENIKDIAPINEDLNVANYEVEQIKQKIYSIRGKQVMLDSDVAELYQYKTKRINETVNRNRERFPKQFCFQLTDEEMNNLKFKYITKSKKENNWSQIATSSMTDNKKHRGKKYLPYVFTEQGIAMLSGLLKNDIAVQVSISIMNAFVEMRKILGNSQLMFNRINNVELKQLEFEKIANEKFETIFKYIEDNEKNIKQQIFFEGQIWDAYNLIIKIIKQAEEKILIIDNYIDDSILEMLTKKKRDVEVIIYTSYHSKISKLDIQKFNREYPNLKVIKTNKYHDRFIAIDNKELYHCGASIKDLGKKCFAITKMEDISYIDKIEENLKSTFKIINKTIDTKQNLI